MVFCVPGLHGAHLRRDLVAAVGRRRVANAVRVGELRGLWNGTLVEHDRLLDPLTRAAAGLLTAGPRSVLVDRTAAFVHGCRSVDVASTHVRVPYGGNTTSRDGLAVHHGRAFADDIVERDGLRVLPLDRVVADLLCNPNAADALAVTDEALRLARPDHEQFRVDVGARLRRRHDPRGTVAGAFLLDLASPNAESPPESWVRLGLVDRGFPVPEVNWQVTAIDGRELFRIDMAWPGQRIALEYDGYEAHADRDAEDAARQAELERRGWIVVRVRKEDLSDMTRVHRELLRAFAHRGYTW
ncbi:MAG: DUF559 domain-containing protein [Pseudonocardia sp.]|nr:DUF559 domain-containing protein [Pseudonocardia sp.]